MIWEISSDFEISIQIVSLGYLWSISPPFKAFPQTSLDFDVQFIMAAHWNTCNDRQ